MTTNVITPAMDSVVFYQNSANMVAHVACADLLEALAGRCTLSDIVFTPAFNFSIGTQSTSEGVSSRNLYTFYLA